MKKIIESDLISIAHRILKLKDKSEISLLLKETELLHNKLILLQFYEDNKYRLESSLSEEQLFQESSKEINNEEAPQESIFINEEKKDDVVSFEEELITPIALNVTNVEAIEAASAVEESVVSKEETTELQNTSKETDAPNNYQEDVEFTPSIAETQKSLEEIEEEIIEIEQKDPIEDAKDAVERAVIEIDPVFSIPHNDLFKSNSVTENEEEKSFKVPQHFVSNQSIENTTENYHQAPVNKSINDAFANKISIGLNDRIAFEKNLFNGNSNDLNRVISQLNTIESYQEAKDFIDDLVKPEFNNWHGKEDYENRFMELVEKRFL